MEGLNPERGQRGREKGLNPERGGKEGGWKV